MIDKRVLILCTGNSARSQMAEAIINAQQMGWQAFSAGTLPADRVNPFAILALAEIDIHPADAHPKRLDVFIGQPFDAVVTVCDDAAENCPVWLGQGQRIHRGYPDPAAVTGTDEDKLAAFRDVRDRLAVDMPALLTQLAGVE